MTVFLAAQDAGAGLASWQTAALFVGVPALAVAIIAAVVLKVSAPATKGAFPVLQPGRAPAHDESAGGVVGPPEDAEEWGAERPVVSEGDAAGRDEAASPLDSVALSEGPGTIRSGGT